MIQNEFTFDSADKERARGRADETLAMLMDGPKTTIELLTLGPRPAAYIGTLKQRGYDIRTTRTTDNVALYTLCGHSPTVEVTPEMQAAYYETEHWRQTRMKRLMFDTFFCCHCRNTAELNVHHWHYDLFNEDIADLATLCRTCHLRIHEYANVQIHFPRSVTPELAARLTR